MAPLHLEVELMRMLGAGTLFYSDVYHLAEAAFKDGWGLAHGVPSQLRDAETSEEARAIVDAAWTAGVH